MIQPTVTNDKRPVSRGLRAITVRLDQPTRERINRRIPTDYRTLSALVRAGIAEVLDRRESAGRRTDR
jgi:Arc/MetJ-type ribon-helix-helix transcriptional regulator